MRLRLAAAGLVVLAAVAGVGAVRTGASAKATASPASPVAQTPVLSARRVPALLTRGAAGDELRAQLSATMAALPTSSCALVAVDGTTMFERNPTEALTPASNEKLLTATAALASLGASYRFSTRFVAAAEPVDGVVAGDVWLVGGGDPLLATSDYLDHLRDRTGMHTSAGALADALHAAGISRIEGRLLGDESRYDSVRYVAGWPARYRTQNQVGPLSALTVNDNFTAWTAPHPRDGDPGATPAADPPLAAASTFVSLLGARGVKVDGGAGVGRAPADGVTLARVSSPPLSQIVREMLTSSDNQTAELLTKELGFRSGEGGTTAAGVAAITAELTKLGLPLAGSRRVDGSGLDEDDRVTCRLLLALLRRAGPGSVLAKALPVAAKDGTLKDRFVDTPGAGRIRAKTGTLTAVSALSGFATTAHGTTVTFSLVSNGATVSDALLRTEERFANDLVAYPSGIDSTALSPAPAASPSERAGP